MIAILNYGIGNLNSIRNMLNYLNVPCVITSDIEEIKSADKLILPGVGAFDAGMKAFKQSHFFTMVEDRVLNQKTPILGICLGFQMFCKSSEEGKEPGLGWIDANVKRFKLEELKDHQKIPHMGWSDVNKVKGSNIIQDSPDELKFYFVHSYYVTCENNEDEILTCNYGADFTAGVEHQNIIGLQFHPEKSHKYGMLILSNFSKFY